MLIFNLIGLIVVASGVALMMGVLAIGRTPLMAGIALILWGVWMIGFDLLYRTKHQKTIQTRKLIHPKAGGHLFFVPLWILGMLPIALASLKLIQRYAR